MVCFLQVSHTPRLFDQSYELGSPSDFATQYRTCFPVLAEGRAVFDDASASVALFPGSPAPGTSHIETLVRGHKCRWKANHSVPDPGLKPHAPPQQKGYRKKPRLGSPPWEASSAWIPPPS